MQARSIVLMNEQGDRQPAELAVCDNCEGETFFLLKIDDVPHMQCSACEQMYCDPAQPCERHGHPRSHDDA